MTSMSDNRRLRSLPQHPEVDVVQIIAEAQTRWLKPVEVCEILKNYSQYGFKLNPVPPSRPPSGSMFLFDRKTLRYFRKDGHNWRKKKDGKTVREAHERLKTGSVDVLHCYYAHGEDNVNFQRRCYWMLDPNLEHIVLVHYREVTEGNRLTVSSDSHHSAPPVYAASPPEVTGPSMSPEIDHDETDLLDGDEHDDFSILEAGQQPSLLEQISTPRPAALDPRSVSPTSNSWQPQPTLDPRSTSSSWTSALMGTSGLGEFEKLLNPGGLYPPPRPSTYFGQSLNNHPGSMSAQGSGNSQLPLDYPGTSVSGSTLGTVTFSELLGKSETFSGAHRPVNQTGTFDIAAWNERLENSRKNQPSFGVPSGVAQYVKQESMNGSIWADMLEQCTTPATRQNLLESIMPSTRAETDAYTEPPVNADLPLVSGIPSPKGIMEALSPRGLGREPQSALEASLRAVTEEKALKAAAEAQQKRFPAISLDAQHTDAHWDGKPSELDHFSKLGSFKNSELESLSKLDSFGRWMSREIGGDTHSSLISGTLQSGSYWGSTIEDQGTVEDMSSLSQHMQVEAGLSPSLSQDQRFSIVDFSPEWAFSSEETKILIVGTFLENIRNPSFNKWCCMFGEVEVPAEVIEGGVLRCKAPAHAPGRVSFYITCGDRQAHSEVREFEYRTGRGGTSGDVVHPLADSKAGLQTEEEMMLKIRLTRMLLAEVKDQNPGMDGSIKGVNGDYSLDAIHYDDDWASLEEILAKQHGDQWPLEFQEQLVQMLLKYRMQNWLLCKVQEEGKGPNILDGQGQGVFHMVAALGYDWAVGPLVAAGIPINFRDKSGWTALHWAAACAREQVIIALLKAGADPGPVTDPSPKYPAGQTPADLAAINQHAGIAGYLAEMTLTSRLSSMSLTDRAVVNDMDVFTSQLAGDQAVAKLSRRASIQRSVTGMEDQTFLQDSLQAVRNAAQAAALIQAAFRQHSFRRREEDSLASQQFDEYGMSECQVRAMLSSHKMQKVVHNEKKQHLAATRIQRKFRGWKGRRDFLTFRQHVVRIQAHVRGKLVRKRFRRLLWSVGILEKAVLRWRRKGTGLRGFKSGELTLPDKDNDEDFLKAERKKTEEALDKAVTRVQSMVRSHQARVQYRRMLEGSRQAQIDPQGRRGDASPSPRDYLDDSIMAYTD